MFQQQKVLLQIWQVQGFSPVWALSNIYPKKLLILVPNQLLIQATRVMFGQQKVLLQMWQVRVLSYMGLIYQIFMPKNFSFSFQTLKTRHFGDVSVTGGFFCKCGKCKGSLQYGPYQIFMLINFLFSFQTLKTHHFGDVWATEGFVANVASVRVLSCMGPIKYLCQKTFIFVTNSRNTALWWCFSNRRFVANVARVRVLSGMGPNS